MIRSIATLAAVVLVTLIVAGCGLLPFGEPGLPGVVRPPQGALPSCADVPVVAAPPEAYRDGPIYVGNEMPVDEVRAWAEGQPGYQEIWIDRQHNGWITVAFTQEAAARQADLEAEFPEVGVVAVPVDRTVAELEALATRIKGALPDIVRATTTMPTQFVVSVDVGVLEPDRIAAVEAAFADAPICIAGADPADIPPEGPQAQAGDGWRLLADELTGESYRTGIAYDSASLEALWAAAGVTAPLPDVDFDDEVVIWFGAVYGSSCPDLRLDDVVVEDASIHAEIVLLGAPMACTADANPRAYVVAVPRERLPAPPFFIQLGAEDPPGGVPEERTVVDADLRVPGAVAGPGQIHGDPNLGVVDETITSGDYVETGFPAEYRMSVHCGVEWLGRLNDIEWRTDDPAAAGGVVPPAWESAVAQDGTITLNVLLSPGPDPTVEATANDVTLVYRPTDESAPLCR